MLERLAAVAKPPPDGPPFGMIQVLTPTLTPLDIAIGLLLDGVAQVSATEVASIDAVSCIAAEMPPLFKGLPEFDVATGDGWALRARDIIGASSYSPLQLAKAPAWIEAGERMPDGCDCVLEANLVEQVGAIFQVVAETTPGHGVRRAGSDVGAGRLIVAAGRPITAIDLLAIRAARLDRVQARSPRVRVIDVPAADAKTASSQFACEFARARGGRVTLAHAAGRDAAAIAAAISQEKCDLLLIVGGTGFGRTDATIDALRSCGTLLAHRIALEPGSTVAIGKIGAVPVVAIPGAPEQALAICLSIVQPALDKLSGRAPRVGVTRPLLRKIASAVGIAELVLLKMSGTGWIPLATGQISLNAIADADAWLVVAAKSEGYAAATLLEAFPLRESL